MLLQCTPTRESDPTRIGSFPQEQPVTNNSSWIGEPMRTMTALLLVAPLALLPAPGRAQSAVAAPTWTGKSVALTRVNGKSMSAACPTLSQIDHYVRERTLKWDKAAGGCRFILSGNFSHADVVEESGEYIRVKFELTSFSFDRTFWTPKRNFKLTA
jgi:hypothetical protein